MDLDPTKIPLNFETDVDHHLDTPKIQRSRFSHLLINILLDGGVRVLSPLVGNNIQCDYICIFL